MKKLSLTSAELLKISDSIRDGFDLHAVRETVELVINPVDPYHIHACWNIGDDANAEQSSEQRSLVLQLSWDQAIENHSVSANNQFHVILDSSKGRKTLRAPVDNVYYRGVIGWVDNTFTVEQIVESNIIHLPRAVMLDPVDDLSDKVLPLTNKAKDKSFTETVRNSLHIPDEAELHDRILRQLAQAGFDGADLLPGLTSSQPLPEEPNQVVDTESVVDYDSRIFDEAAIDQLIIDTIKRDDDHHALPVLHSAIAPSTPLYSNFSGRNIKF